MVQGERSTRPLSRRSRSGSPTPCLPPCSAVGTPSRTIPPRYGPSVELVNCWVHHAAVASLDECLASVQGMVFVDRDGKHFRHVLNWLRDGAIPVLSESEYQQLLREAEYYQLLVNKHVHSRLFLWIIMVLLVSQADECCSRA
jgi:hypothetical protein